MVPNKTLCTLAATLLLIAGCHKAESPEKVQQDLTSASHSGAKDTLKAEKDEAKVDSRADSNMATAQEKADRDKGGAAADTALTEAEGAHKVALAKCEGLAGDRQGACKDEADAQFEEAKAKTKVMKADSH
ncbi:MAG TPA: hypothetical protein VGL55_05485 [Steroidobacteraceae bacterium]|jgi:hypothetical protein